MDCLKLYGGMNVKSLIPEEFYKGYYNLTP